MSGRLHIVDDDDLSVYRIYEEAVSRTWEAGAPPGGTEIPVLRKAGTSFSNLLKAKEYVDYVNSLLPGEE